MAAATIRSNNNFCIDYILKWHFCMCVSMLSRFSRVQLFVTPWTVAHQVPLSKGFSRQRILEWVAMPFSRDLPNPGIEPKFLMSPALAGGFFTTSTIWEAWYFYIHGLNKRYISFTVSFDFVTCSDKKLEIQKNPIYQTTPKWEIMINYSMNNMINSKIEAYSLLYRVVESVF